jgi:membrane protease YdiL (CAAX protease family)
MEESADTTITTAATFRPDPLNRFLALIEIVLVAVTGSVVVWIGLVTLRIDPSALLSDARLLAVTMLTEAAVALILVVLFLRLRREGLSAIGLVGHRWRSNVVVGISLVPLLFLLTLSLGLFFQTFLPDLVTETNPMLALVTTPVELLLFVACSVLVGGLKEEVQRAFVLIRFEDYLGGIWVGLVLWSFFFGWGHLTQGVDNAVGAGLLGLAFGLVFIRRRNLLGPMVSHALFNVLTLTIYWLWIRSG